MSLNHLPEPLKLCHVAVQDCWHSEGKTITTPKPQTLTLGRSPSKTLGLTPHQELDPNWASPGNPMWKFLYKTTMAGLKGLPRKVAMLLAKKLWISRKKYRKPWFLYLLSKTFFLQSAGMLPGMLKGERVASLSEAHSQDSYLKIRERSLKDPRKNRERSAKGPRKVA